MGPVYETGVDQTELKHGFAFHRSLNTRLWREHELRLDVRVALLKAALAFAEFLAVPGLKVNDVIFTGSNAAFNYTEYSDCDVHLIVDYDENVCPEIAENFFNTKKTLWNETHDIMIRDYPVEMYVEDTKNPVTANGVYSLLKGQWIKEPTPSKPNFDDSAVLAKVEQFADQIDTLLSQDKPLKASIDAIISRIYRMRKAGLAEGGEFSVENLAFKGLRNLGYMDRLWDADTKAEDRSLSLETEEK